MALLDQLRAGLAHPFADAIAVGPAVLTRAEARAVERALTCSQQPCAAVFAGGVWVERASSSAAVGRKGGA